jgi:hypothetical protein
VTLYTKKGHPLQVLGDMIYSRAGKVVGRVSGSKVYGKDGHYVGTIDGDRLVYRSTDSAARGSPFSASNIGGSGMGSVSGSGIWGEEPDILD